MPSVPQLSIHTREKQELKQQQAQLFALMAKGKAAVEDFIKLIKDWRAAADENEQNDKYAQIMKTLFLTDEQLKKLINLDGKGSLNEESFVQFTYDTLISDYQVYIEKKRENETADKDLNPAHQPSKLLARNEAILAALQHEIGPNNGPVISRVTMPKTVDEFNNTLRPSIAAQVKQVDPSFELDSFLAYRQDRALGDKSFLVNRGGHTPVGNSFKNSVTQEAIKNRQVPENFGDSPRLEGALLKQTGYSGRTGYPPASQETNLMRAFDIGYTHDEVLAILRDLNPKINLPGHLADKQPNPCRDIKFMIGKEEYGITAKASPDGKKIDFLRYLQSDLDSWGGTHEEFINTKCFTLHGEDCDRKLVTPLPYASEHRSGTYSTVGEALDEQLQHLGQLAGRQIYRSSNLPGYESKKPAAGAGLKTSPAPTPPAPPAPPASAASASYRSGAKPAPGPGPDPSVPPAAGAAFISGTAVPASTILIDVSEDDDNSATKSTATIITKRPGNNG